MISGSHAVYQRNLASGCCINSGLNSEDEIAVRLILTVEGHRSGESESSIGGVQAGTKSDAVLITGDGHTAWQVKHLVKGSEEVLLRCDSGLVVEVRRALGGAGRETVDASSGLTPRSWSQKVAPTLVTWLYA